MKDQLIFDTTDAGTIADSDSIGAFLRSSDGTLLTHTTVGSDEALDVNVVKSVLEQAEDAAHTSGDSGVMSLAVANHTEGALHSADGDYAALQVDSSGRLRVVADLDTANLAEKAEDSAHTTGDVGNYVLGVRQDALASSVSADGDYGSFKMNAKGELYTIDTDGNALLTTIDGVLDSIKVDTAAMVVDLAAIEVEQLAHGVTLDSILVDTGSIDDTLTALSKAEDAAHASGDQGIMGLAVRNDTLASLVSADGDYAPLQVNADGALYVKHDGDLTVSDTANTAIANTSTVVGTTVTDLVGTDLADRKYVFISNQGNKKIYVGGAAVTTANGFPVSPGSVLEMRAGAAIDLGAIKAAGGSANDTRILELS